MSDITNTAATGTTTPPATTTKKTPARLKTPAEMTAAELDTYKALPELKRKQYDLRLQQQTAKDELDALRKQEDAERAVKKAERELETGIKAIIKDVRSGEGLDVTLPDFEAKVKARLTALSVPPALFDKTIERIKTDSVKTTQNRLAPATPAYKLTRRLINVMLDEIIAPTDGARPDITLINNAAKFNVILPIAVRVSPEAADKYAIIDGKRRYYLMPDNAEFEVLLITGFPDEVTAEKAEIIVNRIRSLNVLSTADTLSRMKTRGVEDTEIRRDLGFKTGEIDKITSVIQNLTPDLRNLLRSGFITPSVAIAIAKLPANLQTELYSGYETRKKEKGVNARISEADVEGIRSKRTEEAIKRDAPTLAGLVADTPELEESAPAAPQVDSAPQDAVESKIAKAKNGGGKAKDKPQEKAKAK